MARKRERRRAKPAEEAILEEAEQPQQQYANGDVHGEQDVNEESDHEEEDLQSAPKKKKQSSSEHNMQQIQFEEQTTQDIEEDDANAKDFTSQQLLALQMQASQQQLQHEEHAWSQSEIRALKETETLYSSSLFRLAFTEVLREVGVDWEKNRSIDVALHALKNVLEQAKSTGKQLIDVSAEITHFLSLPMFGELRSLIHSSKVKLEEVKIAIVGSFLIRSIAKPNENVDVTVLLPKLDDNQFGKHEYHVKRALFLCLIAKLLKKHTMFKDMEMVPFRGDSFKPILVIKPAKGTFHVMRSILTQLDEKLAPKFMKTTFVINIHVAIAETSFSAPFAKGRL